MYEKYEIVVISFDECDVMAGLTPGSMDESGGGGSQHSAGGKLSDI
ncbi:MAG: hypothetical protein LUG49_07725 [Oscillospiraceae bacterium]|nr:hypothetical protein [Oscillospiraceae bacterium]